MNIILEFPNEYFLEKFDLHCFQKGFVSFELGMELKQSSFGCLLNETTKFCCFLQEVISIGWFDLMALFFNLGYSMIVFQSFLFKWGL